MLNFSTIFIACREFISQTLYSEYVLIVENMQQMNIPLLIMSEGYMENRKDDFPIFKVKVLDRAENVLDEVFTFTYNNLPESETDACFFSVIPEIDLSAYMNKEISIEVEFLIDREPAFTSFNLPFLT